MCVISGGEEVPQIDFKRYNRFETKELPGNSPQERVQSAKTVTITIDVTPDEAEEILTGLAFRAQQVGIYETDRGDQIDALGLYLQRVFQSAFRNRVRKWSEELYTMCRRMNRKVLIR